MTYLDHAATTPMRQSAIDAWVHAAGELNPNGQYAAGRKARSVLDSARESVAELLGCEPIEVIFTASGTEADNIALQGLYAASESRRIIVPPSEHSAIRDVANALASQGAEIVDLPVDGAARVCDLSAFDTQAAVAACMYANNEIGTIQPIPEIAERAAAAGTPLHVDAVQAVGKLPIHFHELQATTLAASAHKFGGPRGAGLLLAKRTPAPKPVYLGGGQERGIRPGTVDVAGAAGLAAALRESLEEHEQQRVRLAQLRDKLRSFITTHIDDVVVNTVEPALPTHLHVSFLGTDGDSLIMLMDRAGIAVSTGSACAAGVNRFSHVLEAMEADEARARGALRFSLGYSTTEEDIAVVCQQLPDIIATARKVAAF
ncbi:cysteine desulfurase family protein [Corynebacterium pseudodiphtheriticum]|uniref:cysteine desulfurase family protein n=1 Tax=Corynebacterium pseudodiphtheriticum TaxID=37637 RepID=UPI0025407AB7|nr:cysteine desulfurase family protein [Corynebacterium pseudodiphtheriticum]MDK4205938.1 cysteine desulfurase family protein [Corynebacterium pseudodiphtheriticum]MDK4236211.1 cysteine desulfurase family protein [Corynebacterium pseudodiphtheriticum]MDK4272838.1 cysteine desulfurase family protein [Corynebacterium pseudodiphtheriticum]MDK4283234.1 cysteine desulfurase family protein [Corynebacterium pseudodiphtheriticum]MDK8396780.1 cysteine desulfurase family protein [Corynebacterium pseudod